MKTGKRESRTARIVFETSELPGSESSHGATLELSDVSEELVSSPEKIRALMDVLELPEGTSARVTVSTTSSIVR